MESVLFRLNLRDFALGLVVAVLSAVFVTLGNTMNAPGFDFQSFDWNTVLSVAISAGIGYLSKNLITAENGKILGRY